MKNLYYLVIFVSILSSCSGLKRKPLKEKSHKYLVNITVNQTNSLDFFEGVSQTKNMFVKVNEKNFVDKRTIRFYKNLDVNKLYEKYKNNIEKRINRKETYKFAKKLIESKSWQLYQGQRKIYAEIDRKRIEELFLKVNPKRNKKRIEYARKLVDLELGTQVDKDVSDYFVKNIKQYYFRVSSKISQKYVSKYKREWAVPVYFLLIKDADEEDINNIIKIYEDPNFKKYREIMFDTFINEYEDEQEYNI